MLISNSTSFINNLFINRFDRWMCVHKFMNFYTLVIIHSAYCFAHVFYIFFFKFGDSIQWRQDYIPILQQQKMIHLTENDDNMFWMNEYWKEETQNLNIFFFVML